MFHPCFCNYFLVISNKCDPAGAKASTSASASYTGRKNGWSLFLNHTFKTAVSLPMETREQRRQRIWATCSETWAADSELRQSWREQALVENQRSTRLQAVVPACPSESGDQRAVSLLSPGAFVEPLENFCFFCAFFFQ